MFYLISILLIIISVFLILIVLVQNSKGGGLASNFSAPSQIIGVQKTTDFLEKATWTLAGSLILLCLIAGYTLPADKQEDKSVIEGEVLQEPNAIVAPDLKNILEQGQE